MMTLIKTFLKRRREAANERRRQLDIQNLWPRLKECAEGDLYRAKEGFAVHTAIDPAWKCLRREEIKKLVDALD
jgi:hypothetical protein